MIDAELPLEPIEANYHGEVARSATATRTAAGEIGVIASVTQPFCGDCTRLRLSPEGSIVTCLFANVGTDLRGPLRSGASDADLAEIITRRWRVRDDRYSEERASMTDELRTPAKKWRCTTSGVGGLPVNSAHYCCGPTKARDPLHKSSKFI